MGWVTCHPASLAHLVPGPQEAVHGRDRAQVGALVEQHRPHLGRGLVAEALGVQHGDDAGLLLCAQSPGRARPRWRRAVKGRAAPAVVAGPGPTKHLTGAAASHPPAHQVLDTTVEDRHDYSSGFALFEMSSKSACTFPWTSMMASAWASLVRRRSFSARSLATSDSDGPPRPPSVRPRFAFSRPWRCWRRQSVSRLEYNPSRLRIAPF